MSGAVTSEFSDGERVGAAVDGGEIVGAADGDGDDMRCLGCACFAMPWLLLCSC